MWTPQRLQPPGATGSMRCSRRRTLRVPEDPYQRMGGRTGFHTEHLGHLLSELQWMQRTYPGLEW